MPEVLRLGLAGLGTVGVSLLQLIERHRGELTERCGRDIVVTGVSARDGAKQRAADISTLPWFDDPVALATDPKIDVFVELIGGAGGAAAAAVQAALAPASMSSPPTRRSSPNQVRHLPNSPSNAASA